MNIPAPRSALSFALLIWAFWMADTPVAAQQVQTHVNTDSLTVGEVFHFNIVLQQDDEYDRVVFPDSSLFPPTVEVLSRQQYKASQFKDSLIYKLQFFGNEDLRISPLPVNLYTKSDSTRLFTDPVTLYFKSVVAKNDTTFKPLKPIYEFPRSWWPWIAAILVLASLLLWWFYFRDEPDTSPAPEPAIEPFHNPLEALEKQLQNIKEESRLQETRNFKAYYSNIGDAIRTYFEDMYQIPALECTSRELQRYLNAYGVDDILAEKTRQILKNADLVKFAKYSPTLDDARQTYHYALDFLEQAQKVDAVKIRRKKRQYDEKVARLTQLNEEDE